MKERIYMIRNDKGEYFTCDKVSPKGAWDWIGDAMTQTSREGIEYMQIVTRCKGTIVTFEEIDE